MAGESHPGYMLFVNCFRYCKYILGMKQYYRPHPDLFLQVD